MPNSSSEWREFRKQIRMFCYRVLIELKSANPNLSTICPPSLQADIKAAKEHLYSTLSKFPSWYEDFPAFPSASSENWKSAPKEFKLYHVLSKTCKNTDEIPGVWNAIYLGIIAGRFHLSIREGSQLSDGTPFFDLDKGEGCVFRRTSFNDLSTFDTDIVSISKKPNQSQNDWAERVRRLRNRLPEAEAQHLDIIIDILAKEKRRIQQVDLQAKDSRINLSTVKRVCAAATRDDAKVLTSRRGKDGGYGLPAWDTH